MPILLLCAGKLRENYWREAAAEYEKRLSRYVKIEIAEIPDLPEAVFPSGAADLKVMRMEGEAFLSRIRPQDYVIAMCISARQQTSEEFADFLRGRSFYGERTAFVIGGSLGLDEAVLKRADERMSLSAMTMPHQLARIVLLEQVYRACKINAGERYHK